MSKSRYEDLRAELESLGFEVNGYNVENLEIGRVWLHDNQREFEAFANGVIAYVELSVDF